MSAMDSSRTQRYGKPYYRSTYVPPNTRQTLEDRLHPPGISTSSNSSWTFSNSHCDVPKPRKGKLCGICLIGAVLVVALAVIAIAGLAFYIGGYTPEKHHFSEYQTKDQINAKTQHTTARKPPLRHTSKPSTTIEHRIEISSTEFPQTKAIPEGAILGNSETMKQLNNGLKSKKKEDATSTTKASTTTTTTTELIEELYTEDTPVSDEHEQPDTITEDVEIVPEKSTKNLESYFIEPVNTDTKYEFIKNGHARPTYSVDITSITTTSTTTKTVLQPPRRDYSDEPWRPIIPFYRDTIRIRNPYQEEYKDKVFEHRHGPLVKPVIENDSPITFSRESYEQNLRITPEYTGSRDKVKFEYNQNSRISDEIAVKYKDLVKDQSVGSSEGIAEIVVTSDDIVTAPPLKMSDVVIISEASTLSTLSTYYNASDSAQSPANSMGVDQIISGISVVESNSETIKITTPVTVTNATLRTTNVKMTEKTTTTANTPSPVVMTAMNTTVVNTSVSNIKTSDSNTTVKNPFLDDSRSASSNFNFGIPDLPILKQFHHLDSLLKSFSKPVPEGDNQLSKYFVRSDVGNGTTVTRFPVRTKQTTVKSYKKDDTILAEVSTRTPEQTTKMKPVTRKPIMIRGEVEVLSGPIKTEPTTTELPKLITLLPVRSNVNMMRPLRPRPKSNLNSTITITNKRKSKMSSEFKPLNLTAEHQHRVHQLVNDKNGKRWVYYSSSKFKGVPLEKNEKLFIVTPEPKSKINELLDDEYGFPGNLSNFPLYNTIESLLNLDYRNKDKNSKNVTVEDESKKNTSDIVDKIVRIVENVAISTGDSPKVIVKVNQTMTNKTTDQQAEMKKETSVRTNGTAVRMSTKAVASHYKLNQAGVPVLTKILNKLPAVRKDGDANEIGDDKVGQVDWEDTKECKGILCGNGTCLSASKKCNQFIDCPDAADEKNCTCAEHLKAQQLHRKLCDGVVDCWDFTDEYHCEWCHEEFLCSNSRVCIRKDQICDGTNNCPLGDDERHCVTVSPSRREAETFNYHQNGYLMVRKNGQWGKLCIDNFDSVSLKSKTGWKISDLGRTVCKALTFKDFDKVERMISVPNEGRSVGSSENEKYYELAYNEISNTNHSPRNSVLSFHETDCIKREVVKVTCTDLECGLRPQATNQWSRSTFSRRPVEELSYNSSRRSRIVGGGNSGPGSWPWQAALYREGEFQCGATLISKNWLISAGHCFYHHQDAYWVARLGTLRTTLLLPSPYEQLRQISKIILHSQYIDSGFINDISLLRMRDPVRFTDYVRPICLPKPEATIIDGTMCTVVGWGQLFEVGWVFPDTLQEVQLPVLSSHECRKRTIFLPLYKVTDDMFCAGYDRGGRDACLGDSGGPLMCQEPDGKWSLYGVTSNGYGCARSNRPGVYTKVSKYLHWIHTQMSLYSDALIDSDNKLSTPTNKNYTELPQGSYENNEDYVAKLISQRVSNIKLSTDSGKTRDSCKGHRCPLGECLAKSRLCNGHIECSDGSDEKDCWS